ncbi:carbohydrate ABC transporter permease [Clostridium sp.]|uniref:carbohydrate ABC transporter permease n=1 Tax=Clostridium sp. TaxID=1506 RepID=UPI003D6D747F
MRYKTKWYWRLTEIVMLILMTIFTITPIYILISNSLKRTLDIKKMPPDLIFTPTLANFQKIFELDSFGKYFTNSMIIAVSTMVITISLGALAAYGMKLFKSNIGLKLSNIMLLGKLVPTITILIPLYIMLNRVGITGTYFGPILAHSATTLPFITWLLASFIRNIPNELLEAATVMGCSRVRAFFLVIFPLLKPAVASAVILTMQFSWNELMYALQLTNLKTYTLTVGIAKYAGAVSVEWGKCSAAATITILPIIIIGFFMQKYLVTGITAGAVKG